MVIEGLLCRRWWWLRVTLGAHAETIGQVHEAIDGLAFALFPAPTSECLLTPLDRVIRHVTRRLAATRPTIWRAHLSPDLFAQLQFETTTTWRSPATDHRVRGRAGSAGSGGP